MTIPQVVILDNILAQVALQESDCSVLLVSGYLRSLRGDFHNGPG